MDPARDQLLPGARFAEHEDGGVAGGNQVDLLQELANRWALAHDDAAAEGVSRVGAEPIVLEGELRPLPLDLLERPRVRDRDGGVVGEGAQPREGVGVDARATEDGEHTHGLAAERQRLGGEAPDRLALGPHRARDPGGPLRHVVQQDAAAGGADPANLVDAEREAREVAVETHPRLAFERAPGTGDEMEAPRSVRTLRAHAADLADVARLDQPHAGECDPRLRGDELDDTIEDAIDPSLLRDGDHHGLQRFRPHWACLARNHDRFKMKYRCAASFRCNDRNESSILWLACIILSWFEQRLGIPDLSARVLPESS